MYRGLPALQLGKDMRCTEACLHYNWGGTQDVQGLACITTGEGHEMYRGLPALQLGKDMRCTEACLHYNWGRT